MRGVRRRPGPYGYDSENPEPEIGWRQKKERYGGLADVDEVDASPPALKFLRSARYTRRPEPVPAQKSLQQPPAHRRDAFHARSTVTSKLRMRDYRKRIRNGRALLQVEVDIVEVERLLVDAGLLGPDCDDRPIIEAALEKLIALLVADGDTSRHGIL